MSYLLYLRSFVSVYRHSSISRAGVRAVADPTRRVAPCEAAGGAPGRDAVHPAASGWRPRRRRSSWSGKPDRTRAGGHAGRAGGALAGVAHVGATSGFIALLLPALAGLHRRGLRVDLRVMPPPALLSALAERVIDVAVTPARIPHKGVEYQLLHECPQRLVRAAVERQAAEKRRARGLPLIDQQAPPRR